MILFDNCRFLITTPSPDGVIEGGWVLVDGPLIDSVGGPEDSPGDGLAAEGVEVVDCSGKLVMPGMIDSHNHLANYPYNLLPGIDPSSMDFRGISECLEKLIWPAYTWATDESTYDLTVLSMCNAIKHGTTTITSAFPWPDATYRAGVTSGIRTIIHPQAVSNVALGDGLDDEGYLAQTEEVIRNYHKAEDGRIQVAAHPHTTYSCSQRLLLGCMELAERYDVGFAIHMLESVEDRHLSDAQFAEWGGIIGYFQAKGLLQERTLFFHCDQVNRREAEILAEAGVAISHNPQSNATYHGSVADVPTLRAAGVTLGLGTDMPAGNLFDNMYTAFIVNATVPPPPPPRPASTVRALGPARAGDHRGCQGATARGQDRHARSRQTCGHDHRRPEPQHDPASAQRRQPPVLDRQPGCGHGCGGLDGRREVPDAGPGVHPDGRGSDHRPFRPMDGQLRVLVPPP